MPLMGEVKTENGFSIVWDGDEWVRVLDDEESRIQTILREEREITLRALREEIAKLKEELKRGS